MFLGIQSGERYMNNPLSKDLQNIDRYIQIINIEFDVCQCCWSKDFCLRLFEEKPHFDKTALK